MCLFALFIFHIVFIKLSKYREKYLFRVPWSPSKQQGHKTTLTITYCVWCFAFRKGRQDNRGHFQSHYSHWIESMDTSRVQQCLKMLIALMWISTFNVSNVRIVCPYTCFTFINRHTKGQNIYKIKFEWIKQFGAELIVHLVNN